MIVAIETVGSVVRDVQIRPAVVVDVARRHAEAPPSVGHAGAIGDVREPEIAIVEEERGARRRLEALERGACRAVDQIDVEPPVVVDVDERDAARRRVEDERLLGRTGSMPECLEARPGCPILEDDGRAVHEPAGRDRTGARVLDRREHARRAGAAGRRCGRLLGRAAHADQSNQRQRGEKQRWIGAVTHVRAEQT